MSWSAQALCLLLLAAPAWGQVAIPDTPAGENLGAMLSALNSTDESAIEQYIEKYGRGENATNLAQMARRIGYLRLEKIIKSERLRLQYLVHSETLGLQLLAMLEVEDADPPRVSFSLPWLPVPADAAVIGFDVDTATRSSVIREVAAALAEEYVLPEHAAAMADALIEKLESGGYDDVTNGWVLANVLTQDLRSVYDDKHLTRLRLRPPSV